MIGNWRIFHQKEELTTRIKNILDDYPPGIGPFKEFLQNADDAGASSFGIMYDASTYGKEKLLGKGLELWQGPSLLVYNSATFSDNDFENITSLGKSEKFEDHTRIGKYGLGFNVSYHFTDVVSLISRDQYIIFDPHCKYLPQNYPGLRINFLEENLAETFPDQVQSFIKNEDTFGCSLHSAFSGTLFRLPLRTPALAKESKMSNKHYNPKEILSLLASFAKAASTMLLFLKNVEKIFIYFKKPSGDLQTVFVVHIKNISPDIRKNRCLLKDYSKKNLKNVRSSYTLVLSESDGNKEKATSTWLVHNGSCSGSEDLQKQTNQVQWGGLAACLSITGPIPQDEGRAYCFLPLPIKTGLPIHVNGDFALSSNRMDLWHTDCDVSGDGLVKTEWNKEIIENLLVVLYAEILEIYQKSCQTEKSYDFWPDINQTTTVPFDKLALCLMHDIVKQNRKLFWEPLKKQYLHFNQVIFENNVSRKYLQPNIRLALSSAGLNLVDPPEFVVTTLMAAKVPLLQVTPEIVANVIKEKNIQLTWQQGDELLYYILHEWEPARSHSTNFYLLDGIKCLPLVHNQLGVVKLEKKEIEYYTGTPEIYKILETFPNFIDLSSCVYHKLHHPDTAIAINVKQITLKTISLNLQYILPHSWFCRSIVKVSEKVGGNSIDCETEEMESKNETKVEQENEWKEKLRKKNRQKQKHSKPQPPTPEPSVQTEQLQIIFKKLDLLWEYIDNNFPSLTKQMANLNKWPLIRLHEGYIVSLSYAQQRNVLLDIAFNQHETTLLQQLGCLFTYGEGRVMTQAFAKFFGKTKVEACLAISNSLRPLLSTDKAPDPILIQELQTLILRWHEMLPLDPHSVRVLPIFKTIQGNYHPLIPGKVFAAPSDLGPYDCTRSNWDVMLEPIFPERLLCLKDPVTIKLLQIAQNPRLEVMYCIETILLNEIERLPRAVCVQILMNYNNKKGNYDRLENLPIVVLDDKTRHPCKDFLDPTESSLMENIPFDYLGTYPPQEYNHPRILKVMKSAGMMTLRSAKGFLKAAHAVAKHQNIKGAEFLMDMLVRFHFENQFFWNKETYNELSRIPFVPCYNLKSFSFPPAHLVELPYYKIISTTTTRTHLRGKYERKKRVNLFKDMSNIDIIDDLELDEVDDLIDDISESDCYGMASELLSDWFDKESKSKPKNPLPQKELHKFSDGVCLHLNLWQSWKELFILLPSFNRAQDRLLGFLSIHYPPKIHSIVTHLRSLVSIWANNKPEDPRPLQAVVLLCFASANRVLRTKPRDYRLITHYLKNIPVIIYDNNEYVTCEKVVVDLDCDLSIEARAVPYYLKDFPKMLQLIGSPSIDTRDEDYRMVMTSENPIRYGFFEENIRRLFNDPRVSDVQFECREGQKFYAHKLVLSLSSKIFRKMFSGGFVESSGTAFIHLPDEDPKAVSALLHYLYTGVNPQETWYPITQDNVALAIRLLCLSDQYMVPFLKETCEVYLSDPVVLTLRNVVDLFMVANMYNALQLKMLCVRKIRKMINVVLLMEEWKELPEELKKEIYTKGD